MVITLSNLCNEGVPQGYLVAVAPLALLHVQVAADEAVDPDVARALRQRRLLAAHAHHVGPVQAPLQ